MLKRSLFRGMAVGNTSSPSRARNGFRRTVAIKNAPSDFFRPGTPYPKINNVPLVAGVGGTLQLASSGAGPSAYPLPDSAGAHSFTTATPTYHNDILAAENLRLRHELDAVRAREVSIPQSVVNSPAIPNGTSFVRRRVISLNDLYFFVMIILEVGLNMMGLTVSETPLVSPSPERANQSGGDTNMSADF